MTFATFKTSGTIPVDIDKLIRGYTISLATLFIIKFPFQCYHYQDFVFWLNLSMFQISASTMGFMYILLVRDHQGNHSHCGILQTVSIYSRHASLGYEKSCASNLCVNLAMKQVVPPIFVSIGLWNKCLRSLCQFGYETSCASGLYVNLAMKQVVPPIFVSIGLWNKLSIQSLCQFGYETSCASNLCVNLAMKQVVPPIFVSIH